MDARLGLPFSSFLRVLDQMPVALAVTTGPEHVFTYANRLYRDIHEHTVGVLQGRCFRDVFGNLLPEEHVRRRDEVLRDQVPQTSFGVPVKRGDQETFWDITLVPLEDRDVRERGVLTVAVDVTVAMEARRESEAAAVRLAKQADELSHERERFSIAIEATDLGIWEWDVGSNAVYWSPRLKRIFGLPEHEATSYETWSHALHPEDRDAVVPMVASLLEPRSDG
ncbi:MAG: PAS domain-containing protein [Hyphomicrobiales bacterium]